MGEISIIGVDLAKNVFQVHGPGARCGGGRVRAILKEAVAAAVRPVHGGAAVVLRGDGGVRQRPSLGAADEAAGS